MTPERRNSLLRHLTRQLTQMAASTGWGPDMDWIASDRDGHLAVLATAGLGAIPARVTGDPAGLVAVIEEVENLKGFEIDVENAFADIHRPTDWDRWSRPELLRPVAPRPEPPADELA